MCLMFLEDLIATCEPVRKLALEQNLVFMIDLKLAAGTADEWTMDLVLGPPGEISRKPRHKVAGIAEGKPREIWFAMDAKSIMTEHGKARRNRFRDITALEQRVHRLNERAVVGACVALNAAQAFRSQLRIEGDVTIHKNIERLVEQTVELFEGFGRAAAAVGAKPIEGLSVIVVDHTNEPGRTTRLLRDKPAPGADSPLRYENFLRSICQRLAERFADSA